MFVFAHLGIGSKLAAPFSRGLPKRFVYLGTVLPDLIDKPLYYGLSYSLGKQSADLGLISCTRTFGHTALLLLVVLGCATLRKSRALAAVAIGMATHLLLDNIADTLAHAQTSSALLALLWPLKAGHFAIMPRITLTEHLLFVTQGYELWPEIAGILILLWEGWKRRHQAVILDALRERRIQAKLRKSRRFR